MLQIWQLYDFYFLAYIVAESYVGMYSSATVYAHTRK